jgi:hypothetical protein
MDPSEQETLWEFLKMKFPDKNPGLSIQRGFKAIDGNRNNSVTKTEFFSGLQGLGYPGDNAQWKKLFFSLDKNGSGALGLGEFSNWQAAGIGPKRNQVKRESSLPELPGSRAQVSTPSDKSGKKLRRRTSWSHDPSEYTSVHEGYDDRGHLRDAGTQVILQGAVSGWQRAANGAAMTMVRANYPEMVRDGLAALEEQRMNNVKWVNGVPIRRGGNSAFRLPGMLREPKPTRFMVRASRGPQDLPLTSNLKMFLTTDQHVFRRTSYA